MYVDYVVLLHFSYSSVRAIQCGNKMNMNSTYFRYILLMCIIIVILYCYGNVLFKIHNAIFIWQFSYLLLPQVSGGKQRFYFTRGLFTLPCGKYMKGSFVPAA